MTLSEELSYNSHRNAPSIDYIEGLLHEQVLDYSIFVDIHVVCSSQH
jgi:hypothetical protein